MARKDAEQARQGAQRSADRLESAAADYGATMRAVADGDLTRRVDPDADSDAMRAVGEAFNEMLTEIEATLADVKRFSGHVVEAAETADENTDEAREAGDAVADAVEQIADGAD